MQRSAHARNRNHTRRASGRPRADSRPRLPSDRRAGVSRAARRWRAHSRVTLELQSPVGSAGAAHARRSALAPLSRPWRRSAEQWAWLAPRGWYARRVRTPFLWTVALGLALASAPLAALIALVNLAVQRD